VWLWACLSSANVRKMLQISGYASHLAFFFHHAVLSIKKRAFDGWLLLP
jgi:hypothetical protein